MTGITTPRYSERLQSVSMASLAHLLIRFLEKLRPSKNEPAHLATGRQGESEAYFYLKKLGYRIVATNFRAPHDRGEIDIIGWDGDVLCFVEIKTRTDISFAPPSTAVTLGKQRNIVSVAKRYLRHLSQRPSCRFDILSVVPSPDGRPMQFTLRKGAFGWDTGKPRRRRWRNW